MADFAKNALNEEDFLNGDKENLFMCSIQVVTHNIYNSAEEHIKGINCMKTFSINIRRVYVKY